MTPRKSVWRCEDAHVRRISEHPALLLTLRNQNNVSRNGHPRAVPRSLVKRLIPMLNMRVLWPDAVPALE